MTRDIQPEWVQLDKLFMYVWYGEIRHVPIAHGVPRLNRSVRYLISQLLDLDEPLSSRFGRHCGLTHRSFKNLMRVCQERDDFLIDRIIVQAGLPHRIEIEGETRAQ